MRESWVCSVKHFTSLAGGQQIMSEVDKTQNDSLTTLFKDMKIITRKNKTKQNVVKSGSL